MIVKPVKRFFDKNVGKVWLKPPPHGTIIEPWFPYAIIQKPISRALQRLGVYTYNNFIARTTFGLYPREWNPRVHGPYVHYRYYGTNRDVPLMEVKVSDLPAYIARRDKSPRAIWREFMRNFYKVQYFYFSGPEFGNPLTLIWRFLLIFVVGFFGLIRIVTGADVRFRHALYHW
uniref:Uncharacterized protein n=1 Tax=Globodera rostochiensis TaxID=31243 RepID=A0A914GX54_GLORO